MFIEIFSALFFYIVFFGMSATTQGCEEVHVDAETRDGSAHTDHANDIVIVESAVVSEKTTAVSDVSTEQQTDDQLFGVSEDDSENGDASSNTYENHRT